MDISALSLRALRDQLNGGLRDVVMADDDGNLHQMVFVPRFRIPAEALLGGTWPSVALELGGFLIDKYPCCHVDATPVSRGIGADPTPGATDIPCSRAGMVPWTDLTNTAAKAACAFRLFGGRTCRLPRNRDWAAVLLLVRLLGTDLRGNNSDGRDERDADSWENYGVPDVLQPGRCLTGTGPQSWSHNGLASGVFELVGNVWEWVHGAIEDTVYEHGMPAFLDDGDGISDSDTVIALDDVHELANWPTTNGEIFIAAEGANTAEYILYATLTDLGGGQVSLSGCTRGARGSTPSAHGDDASVWCIERKCMMPGGAWSTVADTGLNNTDNTSTFEMDTDVLLGPGGGAWANGDILDCEGELLLVTAVDGQNITVNRGHNSTSKAAHAQDTVITRLSPDGTLTGGQSYVTGRFAGLCDDGILRSFGWPSELVPVGESGELEGDTFALAGDGIVVTMRGGGYDVSGIERARSGFATKAIFAGGIYSSDIGFRAVFDLAPWYYTHGG